MDSQSQKVLTLGDLVTIATGCGAPKVRVSSIGTFESADAGAIYIHDDYSKKPEMRLAVYKLDKDKNVSEIRLMMNDVSNAQYLEGFAALKRALENNNVVFKFNMDCKKIQADALEYAMRLYDASTKL
jgi:hypothetical protein